MHKMYLFSILFLFCSVPFSLLLLLWLLMLLFIIANICVEILQCLLACLLTAGWMDDGFACMFVGVVVLFSKINDFTLLHTSFASFAVAIATVVYSCVCTKCACFFSLFSLKQTYVRCVVVVCTSSIYMYGCMNLWSSTHCLCTNSEGHNHMQLSSFNTTTMMTTNGRTGTETNQR